MNSTEPLDSIPEEPKFHRPLIIKIICILGFLQSILSLTGAFYASYTANGYENEWTIFIKIIPLINIICWIGFWTLRKATLILFTLNIIFTMWVYYHIGVSIFDFYTLLFILIAIVIAGNLSRMSKFI